MMQKTYDVAVVGATGMVGEALVEILSKRGFPLGRVHALASERSVGRTVSFGNQEIAVGNLAEFDFSTVQIGLFSAGASVSDEYAPKAAAAGCVVIDNTSRFRYDDDIPLVVPEVNSDCISDYRNRGIIANPNCSTIQMVVALKPIYDAAGISRINVVTYQAASGAGRVAVEDLARHSASMLNGKPVDTGDESKQLAFNAVPHIDVFQDNRYTREEMKMVWETRKIM
ncbi:MAG: aspartate-semialdehyde dehydrogenase, partial [Pseudomonadota bacterium]|nr:aspartate-semialdehyde dehydrogenase [Pseudomonadota bacterium]